MIQIKYVDTTHQLAEILTKGNCTRDEWNNLLHLFNIIHFSSICCSQNFSSTSCLETTAKRMQEEKGEERIVAKSKPTLNLVTHAATSSSTVPSPTASKSRWVLRGPVNLIGRVQGETCSERTQSRRSVEFSREEPGTSEFARKPKDTRKLVASGNSDIDGTGKIWSHNLLISTAYVRHLEKVLWNVRQRYGLSPGDKRGKVDANAAIWRIFMSVTLQAAVHLGKNRSEIFTFHQELNLALIETLVSCNWETDHGSERNYCLLTRQFSSRLQKPVFSDSVLCLGGICQDPVRAWREKVNWFMELRPFREMDRIDREPMEFEWKIFPGFITLEILAEIRVMMTDMKCEPEHCQKKDHLHVNVKRH